MTLPRISREAIIEALKRFDDLREAEYAGWEGDNRNRHAIDFEGRLYPAKAIVRLASPGAARFRSFEAQRALEELGFTLTTIRQKRSPPWSRDELILALDLYLRHRQAPPSKESDLVQNLSAQLSELGEHLGSGRGDAFRNTNGVYMKLMNYRSLDPAFPEAKGLPHGGKLEKQIWSEFADDPDRCHRAARQILEGAKELETDPTAPDQDLEALDQEEAEEGRIVTRLHTRRERDQGIVRKKKAQALKANGHLACEACGFDFEKEYGPRGQGFIECHHDLPVSELKPGQKTKLSELRLLCANCDRMIHKSRPWLTFDQLKAAIAQD